MPQKMRITRRDPGDFSVDGKKNKKPKKQKNKLINFVGAGLGEFVWCGGLTEMACWSAAPFSNPVSSAMT